ncbi:MULTISPECIES: DUF1614 domain-containing protein [Archaeoglobus]|jgi:uncharacterized membrane protein|uniref:DUF1614 domain-containing protein n=3 Tax=Archaeoglobus fulgidus TaxID=2234 RepID=O29887_ARCFU|nr:MULTISPECIES: DUF1614 domain-containing protein [Archaeoglobus]AAB90871.1 conserved hypothetical protein [Archaeoglobus fulgidus DSM 4304]AIG97180.1 putative membrane protein [Archaeoglobus fulgidus DSM 8774]KUJ94335.1 MAG: hypothetical protein XD40_0429 [Archaeoglobus fulgidus]KUK06365.1 MAG: hypothetical protein XD48_1389 [Archaeoglobus fulgidus]MDI3497180.1 hypothetical protein [Archaeoglobus sp.]
MRDYIFPPLILPLFLLLIFLPLLLLMFIFTGTAVFQLVFGVSAKTAMLIFFFILVGSFINIPIYEREGVEYETTYRIFGLMYVVKRRQKMVVAVNLGGCVFPSILAVKAMLDLLHYIPLSAWLTTFLLTSAVIYYFAKPVPNVGIVVPMLIPPLTAAFFSFLTLAMIDAHMALLPKLSFSTGVLSALFGADILHLKDLNKIGSGVVSIGGAGTFDGIFLTGIFAVIFSVLFV